MFLLLRTTPDETEQVLCVHNITTKSQFFDLSLSDWSLSTNYTEAISNQTATATGNRLTLTLEPYDVQWLVF
ncbi:alpha-glucosidase C-terminal domain-containing protein [Anaerolineales bacterium HSG24]|nr:alpha-glucosidase C-terminal domain-containing protein [Anaerolineales bacterium HSG24]